MSDPSAVLADSTLVDSGWKLFLVVQVLAVFLAVLLFVFFVAGRATGRFERPVAIVVLVGPAIVLLLVGLVVPAIRTIYLGFSNASGTKLLGWKNYVWAFTTPGIQDILVNTLLWIIVAPVVTTALGLTLALLADKVRGEAAYKSLIFMPMAISFVGASIIWKFVYDYREPGQPQIGLLSQIVMALGWDNPPNWMLEPTLNNFLLMVILIWVQTGFAMVVLSAAIKAIPSDIIESARVDGAGGAKMLWRITIPMIRSTVVVVLTTVMIITLKIFDIVRTMTGGNFGTQVLANEMYSQSFTQFNVGRGSALAVILFLAVLPLVGYNIVQLRKERANR
ncbi:sugar ABC transporter permease [Luedemannella helvata]|uniref:ABC transmembrane type-1 domain-containing protein n=1 Tax=Luedemannella helvata TaxID=349315 RepID=A0ABP4WWD7_9ACTN